MTRPLTGCALCALAFLIFLFATDVKAQKLSWRFGMEDTWSQVGGLLSREQKDTMLARLAEVTAAQELGGDININGTAGGWQQMQPTEGAPYQFNKSDELVQILQAHGFTMMWNLRINAEWAISSSETCRSPVRATECAPGPEFEDDLYNYIYALVERYDGDGIDDMGDETPDYDGDDLLYPIEFYLLTGEIEFAGATPGPGDDEGYGDLGDGIGFWSDDIEPLLRTHRIVYSAIHDADPSGRTKLVSSGGIFWDLYTDFPDYPTIDGPTVTARLQGQNNHDAPYTESIGKLRQMLTSFGDDSDGIECDYIGWHPHMAWREVEQSFGFIKQYAPNKPIYVDDMWANIFLQDREDAPGNSQFFKDGQRREGDFPNDLVGSYTDLRRGVVFDQIPGARTWYLERGARHLVKAFASAFGEGAERVCYSGTADFALDRAALTGWINLMGTAGEDWKRKPSFYAMQHMVAKLHDFTAVSEVDVSNSPLTRCYRFERENRNPVYVLWSETGPPPADLDYAIPNGETIDLELEFDSAYMELVTGKTDAEVSTPAVVAATSGRTFSLQLGYAPIYLEPFDVNTSVTDAEAENTTLGDLTLHPQPATTALNIGFRLQRAADYELQLYDVFGRRLGRRSGSASSGAQQVVWNLDKHAIPAAGMYLLKVCAAGECLTAAVLIER